MAVFLLKAKHGLCYAPPPCTGIFPDVPCPSTFANWIEALAAEGITGGCGGGNYCPQQPREPRADGRLPPEGGARLLLRASGRAPATSLDVPAPPRSPTGSRSSRPRTSPAAAAAATTARDGNTPGPDGRVHRQDVPVAVIESDPANRRKAMIRRSVASPWAFSWFRSPVPLSATTFTVTTTADSRRRIAAPGDPRRQREAPATTTSLSTSRAAASTRSRRRSACRRSPTR